MEAIVSVIIPTYNRAHLISETLKSIQDQSLLEWECIIVDDGSTDNTMEVVEDFLKDERFTYHSRPENFSKGAAGSRNFGFELSKGKYIQWLDDDDIISKTKLEYQVVALESNENECFAVCPWDYYWPTKTLELKDCFEKEDLITTRFYFDILAKNQSFTPVNTFLIPKELCNKAGGWNKNLSLNDDAEYITRVLTNSKSLINVQGCFALYRNHSEERLSRQMDRRALSSFLLSLDLINSRLKENGIIAKSFFRWKLLKVFNNYRRIDKDLLEKYSSLFREYGIILQFSWYYNLKHSIFLIVYPIYKKLKNRIN